MAQPVWVTQAGNLGTIPEGIFYQVSLQAYDPVDPNDPDLVYYVMIAGELPAGVQCARTGLITGIPQAIASLQGVPSPVSRNVTSKFAVRAYTEKVVNGVVLVDRIADRTFSLTVTGQNPPKFVTPAGNIGTFYDGSPIDPIQIQISDPDPSDITRVSLATGTLPPGLTISAAGLISGYIIPLVPVTREAGFSRDEQGFDQYPFDFVSNSISRNYQFTLEVTDGKESDIRTYDIYVYGKSSMTADTTFITADNTFITADVSPNRVPFLINAVPSNLGTVRSDNFWAYQFVGQDFDGDVIEYIDHRDGSLYALPPGTSLDTLSGWLYGYLPDMGATERTYTFALILRKTNNPDLRSDPYVFTLTVVGQVSTDVVWLTPANMGTINNGATSLLKVEAVNTGGRSLQYKLEPGSYPSPNVGVYNRLPQGTQLLPSGDIAGRVSFNTFALDLGTTTFDKKLRTRLSAVETTFDMSCTFTVNAFSTDGQVSVYKTFTIMVVRAYNEPYENLYIKAMPPFADRALVNQLIQNTDIFPPDLIFRPADPNFGISTSVIYNHCFGLTSSTYELYMSSLYKNHYWKNLILGEIKTAQALDADGNIIYEVVYSAVQDDLVNSQGISVSKQVTLPYPISPSNSSEITTVYPNSLPNMRDQVIDVVGQISNILPLWMLSKQTNGQVLGFTPAWVITYCKPGTSGQIAYNIRSKYGTQLNRVDFEVDRYELDRLLSHNWDPVADSSIGAWVPTPAETTFDNATTTTTGWKNANGQLVTWINDSGAAVSWTNTYNGKTTTFDATSMRFEAPVDMYSYTDAYDKYLVFPRKNILG